MAPITCPQCGDESDRYDNTDWCTSCVASMLLEQIDLDNAREVPQVFGP